MPPQRDPQPFASTSYRSQVLRLGQAARVVLDRYPLRVESCLLVNHGENATFRVRTRGGDFLLRIHRPDYHTPGAIREELAWLEHLTVEMPGRVPRPVRSKAGLLLEPIRPGALGARRMAVLFEWIGGRFMRTSLGPRHLRNLGQLAARLQASGRQFIVHERRYWNAEGLLGRDAKFGGLGDLRAGSVRDRETIDRGRRRILARLKRFESRFPEKQGLVHADLHFRNVLSTPAGLAAIDFDDCGLGFYAYDLAVATLAVAYLVPERPPFEREAMRAALIEGYASEAGWDGYDEAILPWLVDARRLAMLGWLHTRSDNPKLRGLLAPNLARTARHLRQAYDL